VNESSILVCPWRLVRHHDEQGEIAYPLPCTEVVLDAYRAMVLLELFSGMVQLWTSREQATGDVASVDEITRYLLEGN
jgi:hypothetical protein